MIPGARAEWRPERKPAPPTVHYDFVPCGLCNGSGLVSWTFHFSEVTEACRHCNHGMVVVERWSEI